MNNKLTITLKSLSNSETYKIVANTMLSPYYITEYDILPIFLEEDSYNKYLEVLRDFIFKASIKTDEIFYNKLTYIDPKELLYLKKHYTECLVINSFAKKFAKDVTAASSRSKSFGDFMVSTSVKSDPTFLTSLITDSQSCIDDAKNIISATDEMSLNSGLSHVKASASPFRTDASRLWAHNELPFTSRLNYANGKVVFNNKIYKAGLEGRFYVPNT
jgi:hypothetical protein